MTLFFFIAFLTFYQMTPKISAIIITKNEILNIAECLTSLTDFVDEIVVVDNESADGTVKIAEQFQAKVIQTTSWPGFGPQKNVALGHVTHEWVLSIDADERLTPE